VLLGKGDGTFTAGASKNVSPGDGGKSAVLATADLNGDGRPDFVLDQDLDGTLLVLFNGGDGFGMMSVLPTDGVSPSNVAIADVNGDGHPDVVIATDEGTVTVYANHGDGTFPSSTDYPAGSSVSSVAIADLNGDGHPDLAVTNQASPGAVTVLLNHGDGKFGAGVSFPTGVGPGAIVAVDLNGDGKPDLVTASEGLCASGIGSGVSVLLNEGDGTFAPHVDYPTEIGPTSIAAADLNGDGHPDLAVANLGDYCGPTIMTSETVTVLVNHGDGTFGAGIDLALDTSPTWVTAADLNGDGLPDLAVGTQFTDVRVILNTCHP